MVHTLLRRSKTHAAQHETREQKFRLMLALLITIVVALIVYLLTANVQHALVSGFFTLMLCLLYFVTRARLIKSARVHQMEEVFPDFIELVASNLRAGMTIDRALLLSARKEFSPLDTEIESLGKEILTGKELTTALNDLALRTRSEKIQKTANIINTGIISGGNLSVLLEETAVNMRERIFVEKRAASNVLMYVIFIVFAISLGTPLLFGLSSILVEILASILTNIPTLAQTTQANIPLTLSSIHISTAFIWYFALAFIIMTDILASMILGLVSRGEEKAGLRYIAPLIAVSVGTFIAIRFILTQYFESFFG